MPRAYKQGKRAEAAGETRRRIVDATIDLHRTLGPSRTTVAEIARKAGVGRVTVYKHFPDDAALVMASQTAVADPASAAGRRPMVDDPRSRRAPPRRAPRALPLVLRHRADDRQRAPRGRRHARLHRRLFPAPRPHPRRRRDPRRRPRRAIRSGLSRRSTWSRATTPGACWCRRWASRWARRSSSWSTGCARSPSCRVALDQRASRPSLTRSMLPADDRHGRDHLPASARGETGLRAHAHVGITSRLGGRGQARMRRATQTGSA